MAVLEQLGVSIEVDGGKQAANDLLKLHKSLRSVSKAMGDLADDLDGGARDLNKIDQAGRKAARGLDETEKSAKKASTSLKGAGSFGKAIGDGLAAAGAAVLAAGAAFLILNSRLDELMQRAKVYGETAEGMRAIQNAAERMGMSVEEIKAPIQKLQVELGKSSDIFKKWGISLKDANGQAKTQEQLLTEMAQKYQDSADKQSLVEDAQRIFGEQVGRTTEAILLANTYQEESNRLVGDGIFVYQSSQKAMDDFALAQHKLSSVVDSFTSQLSGALLPVFTGVIDAFVESSKEGGFVNRMFEGFLDLLPTIVRGGGEIWKIFQHVAAGFDVLGKAIGAVAAAFVALINRDWSGAKNIMTEMLGDRQKAIDKLREEKAVTDEKVAAMISGIEASRAAQRKEREENKSGERQRQLDAQTRKKADDQKSANEVATARAKTRALEEQQKKLTSKEVRFEDTPIGKMLAQADAEYDKLINKQRELIRGRGETYTEAFDRNVDDPNSELNKELKNLSAEMKALRIAEGRVKAQRNDGVATAIEKRLEEDKARLEEKQREYEERKLFDERFDIRGGAAINADIQRTGAAAATVRGATTESVELAMAERRLVHMGQELENRRNEEIQAQGRLDYAVQQLAEAQKRSPAGLEGAALERYWGEIDLRKGAVSDMKRDLLVASERRRGADKDKLSSEMDVDAAFNAKTQAEDEKIRQQLFSTGWDRAFDKYKESALDAGQAAEEIFGGLAGLMEDTFYSLATTGKANLREFGVSFLQTINKMIMQMLVAQAIGAAMNWWKGGAASTATSAQPAMALAGGYSVTSAHGTAWDRGVKLFANGGVVDSPTAFGYGNGKKGVMGEAGPEAIIPLKRGADGKLGVAMSGGGGSIVGPTFNVTINGDIDSKERMDAIMKQFDARATAITKQQIANARRPGGQLHR